MMKHFLWIEVNEKNVNQVLLKLFKARVEVYETKYNHHSLQFKILAQDYSKLKKIIRYKFKKVRHDGIYHWKDVLKKKWLILVGILFYFAWIFFFSNIIVNVQVIHSNKDIRELVIKALSNYGIERLTLKKDFQEIEKIKQHILDDFPDQLEWMSIEVDGMQYVVRIEERIITKPNIKRERCNLVATKSAIVKKISYSVGESKVMVNDFVREGDILVSGELKANEELVKEVCAEGEVMGEVWYKTNVSLPMDYEVSLETGKKRYNISFSKGNVDKYIFRPRLNRYVDEKKLLFSIFGYEIYFVVQKEVRIENKTYTEEEALSKSFSLVDEKIQQKLRENEMVLDKKVLKKNMNNSKMDIEVFVAVLENISKQEEFQEIKEEGI